MMHYQTLLPQTQILNVDCFSVVVHTLHYLPHCKLSYLAVQLTPFVSQYVCEA